MQVLVLDRQIRPVKFIKVQQQAMLSSSIQKFMFLIIFFFFLWNGLTVTKADQIHVVGDDAGWTVGGNLSYRSWAASKAFHVGDTIGICSLLSFICLITGCVCVWIEVLFLENFAYCLRYGCLAFVAHVSFKSKLMTYFDIS